MFRLVDNLPEIVIFQCDLGEYVDYSNCATKSDAWNECKKSMAWINRCLAEGWQPDELKQHFMSTVHEMNSDEVLSQANSGIDWPVLLGYVERIN